MNCINLRIRSKNYKKYFYCTIQEKEIDYAECKTCLSKRYKPSIINKVSSKREFVQPETYKAVYDRDNGKCVLCNATQGLELHHIEARKKGNINDIDNCVMLCTNCHINIVHHNLKKYRPMLHTYITTTK
jgi:5-methylcytosine-specific restriction endonuclease McrA